MIQSPAARVFVAEEGGAVVGFAAMSVLPLLERDRQLCRLTALIVAREARGRGLGRLLVSRVEEEAAQLGCDRLEVTSSVRRDDAHVFYGRLGFEERRRRFVKPVASA